MDRPCLLISFCFWKNLTICTNSFQLANQVNCVKSGLDKRSEYWYLNLCVWCTTQNQLTWRNKGCYKGRCVAFRTRRLSDDVVQTLGCQAFIQGKMLDDYLVLSDELKTVEFFLFGSLSELHGESSTSLAGLSKSMVRSTKLNNIHRIFFCSTQEFNHILSKHKCHRGLRTARYMHEPEAEGHQALSSLKKLQFKDLFQIVKFSPISTVSPLRLHGLH